MTLNIATSRPPERRTLSPRQRDRLLNIASPIVLLAIWEVAAIFRVIDIRFFPAPSDILVELAGMIQSGELAVHASATLQRLLWGSLIGGVPALVLGVAMGLSRVLRAIVDPLVSATYPIPKSAILPLALLIFGLGEGSKIFMVAIGMFYPVLINSCAGVQGIDRIYLDVGQNFHAGRWKTFWTIALPGALPSVMTGLRLGIGLGLVLIAVAEMVGSSNGLGYMIWQAWQTFSVEKMYVGLFTIAIIGFLVTIVLNWVEHRVIPWKQDRR